MDKVSAIQMASGPNREANLFEASRWIEQASKQGARLVVLPENFAAMGMRDEDVLQYREQPGDGPIQDFVRKQCRRHGIWMVAGTIPLHCEVPDKMAAACMLYDDRGELRARYDKIHLFDVTLVASGEKYNESATIHRGSEPVVAETPFGHLGLTVCYDLRFPELFRALLDQGAEIITLPAAFTALTGRAHWESLLRARAIENLVYLIASGQGGFHVNGRETYGHSMIIDPWGTIKGQRPHSPGVVTAMLDRQLLREVRTNFPCTDNRRLECRMKI